MIEISHPWIGFTSITVMEDSRGNGMKILLERQPVVMHRVFICQRTISFYSKDLRQVVKLSWPFQLRPPEADLLRRARDHGFDSVTKLLGQRPITSIEELRDGLTLPDSHRFRNVSYDTSISFSGSQSHHRSPKTPGNIAFHAVLHDIFGQPSRT